MKLRPNWVVQELVEGFGKARPTLLELGRREGDKVEGEQNMNVRRVRSKRKRSAEEAEDLDSRSTRRKTRSQSKTEDSMDGSVSIEEEPQEGTSNI